MMTTYKLNKDVTMNLWGTTATLPKGTFVTMVAGPGGGFAIASTALLIRLSGNAHDPVYRYAWVKPEDVETVT